MKLKIANLIYFIVFLVLVLVTITGDNPIKFASVLNEFAFIVLCTTGSIGFLICSFEKKNKKS